MLWRVENGVGLAPHKIDPMSPFATHWLEQANEGKIESVALTSSSAWYLTNHGVIFNLKMIMLILSFESFVYITKI